MKQTRKGFVEVPTTTLNALKNMLFDNEVGVDLSSIISDLTFQPEQRDLTAINVALAYKGVRVQIDARPHYSYDWKNRYNRYDYVGHSLILGIVKAKRTLLELAEDGTERVVSVYENIEGYSFDQWEEFNTDLSTILAIIEEKTKVPKI